MSTATGVSVKGAQALILEGGPFYTVAVRIDGGFPDQAKYQGFLSIEVNNTVNSYQADGRSLWYEGVLLYLRPEFRSSFYFVMANWREAGVGWEVITY